MVHLGLEEVLSAEDKEYVLNELEQERRRMLIDLLCIYKDEPYYYDFFSTRWYTRPFFVALLPELDNDDHRILENNTYWRTEFDSAKALEVFLSTTKNGIDVVIERFKSLIYEKIFDMRAYIDDGTGEPCLVEDIDYDEIEDDLIRAWRWVRKNLFITSDNPLLDFYNLLFQSSVLFRIPGEKKSKEEIVGELKLLLPFVLNNKRIDYQSGLDYKQLTEIIEFNQVHSVQELLECATIESPYQVVCKLGEGKSGATYKVYSPELKKYFALKVIKDKFSPKEAELMARLKGEDLENIVQVHDAGGHIAKVAGEERYAIVMEYVDGYSLAEVIELTDKDFADGFSKRNEIHEDLKLGFIAQILNGIMSLRRYGITHRDLNPENIRVDKQWNIKILDFGLATDEATPSPVDARTYGVPEDRVADDLFSLGLITYELFTGEHLVLTKDDYVGHSTHAERIAALKKSFFEDKSTIQRKLRSSLNPMGFRDKRETLIIDIIESCLYGTENAIDEIKEKLIKAYPQGRFYFMRKPELIGTIRQLEQHIYSFETRLMRRIKELKEQVTSLEAKLRGEDYEP